MTNAQLWTLISFVMLAAAREGDSWVKTLFFVVAVLMMIGTFVAGTV